MSARDEWAQEYYKLDKIEKRMNGKILKVEMSTVRHAMEKFASMSNFTLDYSDGFFSSGFSDGPKKYLHLYFTCPRGTKKKPDTTMRFINDYVLNDIMRILSMVFPKYDSAFACVRIDHHADVWQFDVYYK